MTSLHAYFILRNQQAFQRLLDVSRAACAATASGPALSTSGGRSWNKPSPLSANNGTATACDVNARDWLGRTVLHLAVSSLDPAALEFVKLLLTHPRIDVNMTDTESRWSPLHRALYAGNLSACILLLQRPEIDTSLKDFEGYTAFDVYNSTVEGTKPNEQEETDLFTWGTNRNAALGVGDGDDRAFPELVPIPSQKDHQEPHKLSIYSRFKPLRVKQVSMAKLHTAAVTSESRANLRICGFGSGGRLGVGIAQHTQYALAPLKDLTSEAQIIAVALGQDHTLALTNVGGVLSWGLARFSQLGYALDGGLTIQAAPRRIVGPLKKEFVIGVAACRTASACWTESELFTWGTNGGQLGYDRFGTPVQVLPRRVTQVTLPVIDATMTDNAMAVLLSSRDVQCFHNGRSFKINFPTQKFPSEIQAYRPPMAQNNASIAKVVSCENTFAALSSNGEVFTFTLNTPPATPAAETGATSNKGAIVNPVRPQRIWALRKQFSAVKDVALGSDGTIMLCTESGHVYVRSRTNKTSKFTRVPLIQKAVSVAASSAGAFAVLKAECAPVPIDAKGNSVAEDLKYVQPYLAELDWSTDQARCETSESSSPTLLSASGQAGINSPLEDHDVEAEEDAEDVSIKKDTELIDQLLDLLTLDAGQRKIGGKGVFRRQDMKHGADLFVYVDSGFEFPVHRVIFAARSEILKNVLLGRAVKDLGGRIGFQLGKSKSASSQQVIRLSGVHPLAALLLSVYLYTDEIPAIWDRRIALPLADKFSKSVPKLSVLDIRTELQKLASLLHLPFLVDALDTPVKRLPAAHLAHDMKILFDGVQPKGNSDVALPPNHPCAPDCILELSDAHVYSHATVLRARSPFFAGFLDDPDWTAKRWSPERVITVNLKHMRSRSMKFVMQFIYTGGGREMFDVLDFVQTVDDVLEFMFEVMDVAGELLLDRLLLVCSSIILKFLNINNACFILSDASHYSAGQLITSVQGYLARNVETLLESRMLDDLPTYLVRQLSTFVRERQAEKLPVTRSGKMLEKAFESWRQWLSLQDIPQTITPARKGAPGHIRRSPKISPVATGKRIRRPSIGTMPASYSPPLELLHPPTPPSAPIREAEEVGPDDIFVMDDVREEIPPLDLPASLADPSSSTTSTPSEQAPASFKAYSPWKSRSLQLSSSKLNLRSIMAEAEEQRSVLTPSITPPSRPRTIGLDVSGTDPQKAVSSKDLSQSKANSPWRLTRTDPVPVFRATPGSSETLQNTPPSSLGRTMRENKEPNKKTSRGSASIIADSQAVQTALGKGKAPLGPTFAPTRQVTAVGAAPMSRRVSEGSSKAWAATPTPFPIIEPKQPSVSATNIPPLSFRDIQQQQSNQEAGPTRAKMSLREIQEEEQARVAEERALQEEIDFMRWWAAEEDRIRRETQAQPGPPLSGPLGRGKEGKKPKGMRKKDRPPFKGSVSSNVPAAIGGEGHSGVKERAGNAEGQKSAIPRHPRAKPSKSNVQTTVPS